MRQRTPRHSGRQPLLVVLVGLGVLSSPGPVSAQDEASQERETQLTGRIVDASTGAPIPMAFISLESANWGVATDSVGVFALPVPWRDTYRVAVEQLGYVTTTFVLVPDEPGSPVAFVTLEVEPDAILLEGLEITVDRFEFRRRMAMTSVRVLGQNDLLRRGGETAFQLVERSAPFARMCWDDPNELCQLRRGRNVRMKICIDDRPAWGGISELDSYMSSELYIVELYGVFATEIRLYTRWYVDQLSRTRRRLMPLSSTLC
jgi:hypothetical protein